MVLGFQGILLQIFTQPVSDRPTVFLEIIQRLGCIKELHGLAAKALTGSSEKSITDQAGGCGNFPLVQSSVDTHTYKWLHHCQW